MVDVDLIDSDGLRILESYADYLVIKANPLEFATVDVIGANYD